MVLRRTVGLLILLQSNPESQSRGLIQKFLDVMHRVRQGITSMYWLVVGKKESGTDRLVLEFEEYSGK